MCVHGLLAAHMLVHVCACACGALPSRLLPQLCSWNARAHLEPLFTEQNPRSDGPLHSLCWVLLLILRSLLVLGEKFLFFWNLSGLNYYPLWGERKRMIPSLLVGSFR